MPWSALSASAFRRALHAGLGRALIHVHSTGRVPDEAALWAACTTCQTHDWALEGHRAPWLWRLLGAAGLQQAWADRLLAALPEARSTPDADQLAGLVGCLAEAGHPQARPALRAMLSSTPDPSLTVCGARELVLLDGESGLHTVAEVVGAALLQGDAAHHQGLGTWLSQVEDILGPARVRAALATAAGPAGAALRSAWYDEETTDSEPPPDPGPPTPAPLEDSERQTLWMQVHACALALSRGAPAPLDADELARALARLRRRPPQQLDPLWLSLDSHPDSRVRRQLSRLFTGLRDPLLRALALEGPLGHPDRLRWMVRNLLPEDVPRILAALALGLEAAEEHDRCSILLRMHEVHPGEGWLPALLHVYRQAPSSLHREEAVVRLMDDDQAPDWLLAEARFDAHPDVAAAASFSLAS
jgi:hypothetical protein